MTLAGVMTTHDQLCGKQVHTRRDSSSASADSVCSCSTAVPSWDQDIVAEVSTGASEVVGSGGNTLAVDIVDPPEFASFAGHIRSILASFSRPRGLRSAFHVSNNGQNGSRGLKTVEKSAGTKNHTWKNASLIIHKQRVANVHGNLRAIPAI